MTDAAKTTQTTTCRRCDRPLTSARSLREAARNGGYGRGCAHRIDQSAKAAAMTQPAERIAKAVDAIADGAVAHRTRNLFQVVSSDGHTVYQVDLGTGGCTCKAAQYGRHCWHLTSAALLAA